MILLLIDFVSWDLGALQYRIQKGFQHLFLWFKIGEECFTELEIFALFTHTNIVQTPYYVPANALGGPRESRKGERDRTDGDRFSVWRSSWARRKLWKSYSLRWRRRRRWRDMYVAAVGMWSSGQAGQPCSGRGRGKEEEDVAKRRRCRLHPHTCPRPRPRPRPPSRQKDKNSAELSLSSPTFILFNLENSICRDRFWQWPWP